MDISDLLGGAKKVPLNEASVDVFVPYITGGIRPEVPGSQRYSCHQCRRDSWLSPTGVARVRRWPETKVVCFVCMTLHMIQGKVTAIHHPSPDEMARDCGKAVADQIMKDIERSKKRR